MKFLVFVDNFLFSILNLYVFYIIHDFRSFANQVREIDNLGEIMVCGTEMDSYLFALAKCREFCIIILNIFFISYFITF